MDVGFGALTGNPFAFTGARVPALSAFLCSRWIYVQIDKLEIFTNTQIDWRNATLTLSFFEIGMFAILLGAIERMVLSCCEREDFRQSPRHSGPIRERGSLRDFKSSLAQLIPWRASPRWFSCFVTTRLLTRTVRLLNVYNAELYDPSSYK